MDILLSPTSMKGKLYISPAKLSNHQIHVESTLCISHGSSKQMNSSFTRIIIDYKPVIPELIICERPKPVDSFCVIQPPIFLRPDLSKRHEIPASI